MNCTSPQDTDTRTMSPILAWLGKESREQKGRLPDGMPSSRWIRKGRPLHLLRSGRRGHGSMIELIAITASFPRHHVWAPWFLQG